MKSMNNQKNKTIVTTKSSFKGYLLFSILVVTFGFLIAKDVPLPKEVTLPACVIGLMVLLHQGLVNPQFALLILIAYLPFSKILVGRFGSEIVGLNLTNILILIVVFGWISHVHARGEKIFRRSPLNTPIILFCLWGLFTVFKARFTYGDSYNMESFFILFKRWVTPIFLFFISLNMVKDREGFKKAVFIMMTVTFIVALMAIRDYMNIGDSGSLEDSRVGGVFEQPNMLGGYFVYNMFFFLGFFFYYWRSVKYWLLFMPFLACFRGIMVTFSRGAYLAFGFGTLMTTFFKSKILFVCALILICMVLMNPFFLPEGMRYRLASTFGGEKIVSTDASEITDPSAGRRIVLWQGAIAMIKDQPLFGYGYGTFPYIIGYYVPQLQDTDAHNTYLIIAAEMGVPALIIFMIILFILIANAWWLLGHTKDRYFKSFALGMLGGLFGLLVVNMFGSRLNSEEISSYFWLLSGLLMSAVMMRKKGQIT